MDARFGTDSTRADGARSTSRLSAPNGHASISNIYQRHSRTTMRAAAVQARAASAVFEAALLEIEELVNSVGDVVVVSAHTPPSLLLKA